MNQEIQDDEVTIDLMELFSALWAKKTIIILSAVFMALVAFVGTKMFVTPKYTSVTKLYVMAKNDDSSASATYSELQSGSMLTKDYMELVKSRPVLEKTIMEHMVLKYLLQERDIENSIGYGYRMRKIIEHAKISLRQKAVEYYGWSYIRSMFA